MRPLTVEWREEGGHAVADVSTVPLSLCLKFKGPLSYYDQDGRFNVLRRKMAERIADMIYEAMYATPDR